ncbi:MAG TPA: flagellar basal body P-ring formation chaperone FlgA [Bryobacteraceae bacterium]|jgi:flagella basal body P-ring formation protein FlgA|nr:flagellar basal body P-ring formation chaperone FlgA [Bryobacteraceae bacterium]
MRIVIILVAVPGLVHAACLSVPGAKIVAGDVGGAVSLFARLAPETPIGFAPLPGTQRVLSSHELFLIAAANGLRFPSGELAPTLCVERAVRPLSIAEVRPVLLSALGVPDVAMEILEISDQLVPPGRLEFRREELNRPAKDDPQNSVIWRGQWVYDGQHSLAVWAKVRMAVNRDVVVAAQDIPAESVIRAEQMRTIVSRQFPLAAPSLNSAPTIDQIAGKMARRGIAAGEKITVSELEAAKDVIRGETVHVRVVDGAATVTLDALAQSSGTKGDSIIVHNPTSGKNFRAVIEERGQATVVASRESTP